MAWTNIGFLFGLTAVGVPLLIHLLRSRRRRRVNIGSVTFLRQALNESRRTRRLRELLLLLARVAAVVLLALVFARPFRGVEAVPDVPGEREVVVLIDASGSMGGTTLGTSNFRLALDEWHRLETEAGPGTDLTAGVFSHEVRELGDGARCGGDTDYLTALRWSRERLSSSPAHQKEVVIISDLQSSGIPSEPLTDWPLEVPVRIVSLPMPGTWNVAVRGVRASSAVVRPDVEVVVSVGLYGDTPEGGLELTLQVEGCEEVITELPAGRTVLRVPWEAPGPGLYRGVVRIKTGDAFPLDDSRPFAFILRQPVQTVLVDGDPGPTPYQDETYYLDMALRVSRLDEGTSEFVVERREEPGNLDDIDVVALCNTALLQDAAVRRLAERVHAGAGVVHFLGKNSTEDAVSVLRSVGVFPGALARTEGEASTSVYEWDTSHPALGVFGRPESGDLSRITFRQAFTISPSDDARVLAWFPDGSAAVLASSHGAGRVVVVANPCDREWTDWPRERIFLPFVRELFQFAAGTRQHQAQLKQRIQSLDDTEMAGVYGDDPVTVVVPSTGPEAHPAACTEEEFRARLGLGTAPLPELDEMAVAPPPSRSEKESELWPFLALALLVLLLAENALADRVLARNRGITGRPQRRSTMVT